MNTTRSYNVAEFLGDGISQELSLAVHSVLRVLPFEVNLRAVDLSLENRGERGRKIFEEAYEAIRDCGCALKYPTYTGEESPNKILREMCDFAVIHRPLASVPGIPTNWVGKLHIDVVRVATGGTYEDAGRRVGRDSAVSIRVMQRLPCLHAVRYAFRLAERRSLSVTSTSMPTLQRATDGLFEEVAAQVARDHPSVPFRHELFNTLLWRIVMHPELYDVIVLPNEYGDFLSETACGLIGSIGLGDSATFSFEDSGEIALALFDPAGGVAPDIASQDLCNPSAIFFALSTLLRHLGEDEASEALKTSTLECIASGQATRDVGGSMKTSEFTAVVARQLEARLCDSSD